MNTVATGPLSGGLGGANTPPPNFPILVRGESHASMVPLTHLRMNGGYDVARVPDFVSVIDRDDDDGHDRGGGGDLVERPGRRSSAHEHHGLLDIAGSAKSFLAHHLPTLGSSTSHGSSRSAPTNTGGSHPDIEEIEELLQDSNSSAQTTTDVPKRRDKENDDNTEVVVIRTVSTGGSWWQSWKHSLVTFAERFGVHAGKTVSDQLKDPLTQLARSPVFETGEVQVIHQLDMEQAKELLSYVGLAVIGTQFSRAFLTWWVQRRDFQRQRRLLRDRLKYPVFDPLMHHLPPASAPVAPKVLSLGESTMNRPK